MSSAPNHTATPPTLLAMARYLAALGAERRDSPGDVGNFERGQLVQVLNVLHADKQRPVSALKAAGEGVAHAWRADSIETRDEAWLCAAVFELLLKACEELGLNVHQVGPAAADRPSPAAVAGWLATWGPTFNPAGEPTSTLLEGVDAMLSADPPDLRNALELAQAGVAQAWRPGATAARGEAWLCAVLAVLLAKACEQGGAA